MLLSVKILMEHLTILVGTTNFHIWSNSSLANNTVSIGLTQPFTRESDFLYTKLFLVLEDERILDSKIPFILLRRKDYTREEEQSNTWEMEELENCVTVGCSESIHINYFKEICKCSAHTTTQAKAWLKFAIEHPSISFFPKKRLN